MSTNRQTSDGIKRTSFSTFSSTSGNTSSSTSGNTCIRTPGSLFNSISDGHLGVPLVVSHADSLAVSLLELLIESLEAPLVRTLVVPEVASKLHVVVELIPL